MTRVNSPAILNLIFLIDKVDMKIVIWVTWWVVVKTCLLDGLLCFITCKKDTQMLDVRGQDAYLLLVLFQVGPFH